MSLHHVNTSIDNSCGWCGLYHLNTICPRIRAITYDPNGHVAHIEFFGPLEQSAYGPLSKTPLVLEETR